MLHESLRALKMVNVSKQDIGDKLILKLTNFGHFESWKYRRVSFFRTQLSSFLRCLVCKFFTKEATMDRSTFRLSDIVKGCFNSNFSNNLFVQQKSGVVFLEVLIVHPINGQISRRVFDFTICDRSESVAKSRFAAVHIF